MEIGIINLLKFNVEPLGFENIRSFLRELLARVKP